MSAAKRRISGGKATLLPVAEDVDDDDDDIFDGNNRVGAFPGGVSRRNSLGGRRRASFGSQNSSKSPMSAAEQTRIAEMYKTVIKMSTENKINDKNSWTFDLIDHMGKLIKDDAASQRGINFQKASCTLDASVKIYSHRVDDTHSSSHRILESLSRSYGDDDEDNDNDDGSPSTERRAARVGSKAASSRLNIAETLEKDPEKNLNAPMVDSAHTADPLFHKMSKAFDEGGAKGMLMTNLRLSSEACSLFFASPHLEQARADVDTPHSSTTSSTGSTEQQVAPFSDKGLVDVSDLIFKCGFTVGDLLPMTVSSALDDYRRDIGIEEQLNGLYDKTKLAGFIAPQPPRYWMTSTSDADAATSTSGEYATMVEGSGDGSGGDDYYDANDNDDDDGDNDYYDSGDYADNALSDTHSGGKDLIVTSAQHQHQQQSRKIQWEPIRTSLNPSGVNGGIAGSGSAAGNSTPQSVSASASGTRKSLEHSASDVLAAAPMLWQSTGVTSTNDYAFYDIDAALKSNSWAGARHWKYATRSRATVLAASASAAIASAALVNLKKNKASSVDVVEDGDEVENEEVDGDDAVEEEGGEEEEEEDDGDVDPKEKKRKATAAAKAKKAKDQFVFNFTEFVSEELFELPKSASATTNKGKGGGGGGSDPTRLTAAALAKEAVAAAQGELFLPPDAKLQTRDLCRLLMTSNIIVPPPMLAHVFLQSTSSSAKHRSAAHPGSTSSFSTSQMEDIIWGQPRKLDGHNTSSTSSSAFSNSLQGYNGNDIGDSGRGGTDHYDGDEGDGDGGFYEDDDGDDDDNSGGGYGDDNGNSDPFETSASGFGISGNDSRRSGDPNHAGVPPVLGLAINTANLLRASRTVAKIDIGYATTAKRVNVRKLKSDIWNHVDKLPSSSLASPQPSLEIINDENKQPNNGYGFGTDHDDGKLLLQKNSSKQTKAASSSTVSAIGEGKMSFQELVRDISSSQNQKDATLPFYFICLLHLANEKTLSIEGISSMGDLIISKDI